MSPLQVLILTACGIHICSAGEKKCPPEGYDLQALELASLEDYKELTGHWRTHSCIYGLYCNFLSCIDFIYGKGDKGLVTAGSAYNESSTKIWTFDGFFTLKEPGNLQLEATDKRTSGGKFRLLALNKRFWLFACCFADNSFGAWLGMKGSKLDVCDLLEAREIAEKNGFTWTDFREVSHEKCDKKKGGFR